MLLFVMHPLHWIHGYCLTILDQGLRFCINNFNVCQTFPQSQCLCYWIDITSCYVTDVAATRHILEWTHKIQVNRIKFIYIGCKIRLCACVFKLMDFLTNDRVDILGCILSKSTDAGALSWHSETGQWPLAVHILTNHWPYLSNASQSVDWKKLYAKKHLKIHDAFGRRVLTLSAGSVWCLSVQRCEQCLCHWRRTGRRSHDWSLYWRG